MTIQDFRLKLEKVDKSSVLVYEKLARGSKSAIKNDVGRLAWDPWPEA